MMKYSDVRLVVPLMVLLGCSGAARSSPSGDMSGTSTETASEAVPAEPRGRQGNSADVDPERSEIVPSQVVVTRGDTVEFRGVLRDSTGTRVVGARWGVFEVPGVFRVASIKHRQPDTYLLWGEAPGEAELRAVLVMREGRRAGLVPLAVAHVRVEDWPAARIELDSLPYAPYAGSSFQLGGRVLTTHGTEHATAEIRWSSSDPEVLSITPDGRASLHRPGRVDIRARSGAVSATREVRVLPDPIEGVSVEPRRAEARTGEVVRFSAAVRDDEGRPLPRAQLHFTVTPVEGSGSATVDSDGGFVAEEPGVYRVFASAGRQAAAAATVTVTRRDVQRTLELVGRGPVSHVTTSDLWVFEGLDGRDYAYTGTHYRGGGQRMYVWDVTDPSRPTLTDSVVVDARVVNDVKVNDAATIAVITREGASDRRNGIVLLDVRTPAHPAVISQFTESLTAGVHNTWIEGELVYAVNDGTRALHIIDISDPEAPRQSGRWELRPGNPSKYLHDVWVKDGLAYVSYWDDGLVILDVGAGIAGGTPTEPRLISRIAYPEGNTHVAFRYRDYVFVGDEFMGCRECIGGPRGYIHVIDVSDIERPREVGRFEVPEAGSHNVWVEDDRLYVAYYQGGLRVVDISGELRGDLYAQGRQIGRFDTGGRAGEAYLPNAPMAWGTQLHKGHIFVSDMNSGLWVLRLGEPERVMNP